MRILRKDYVKFILILPLFLSLLISTKTLDRQLIIRYLMFGFILFFVSSILLRNRREIATYVNRQIRIFFIIYSVFIFVGGISLIYTNNFSDGLFTFTKLLLIGIYILYIFFVFKDPILLIKYFTRAIVVLGFIVCSIGLYQIIIYFTNGINDSSLYEITATFGNKNVFVQNVFFIFPFSAFVAITDHKYWKIAAILVSITIVGFITLLMTRSVWVAFVLSVFCVVCVGSILKIFKLINYKRLLIPVVLLISVVVSIVFVYSKYDEASAFSKQITGYGPEKGRLVLWQNSLEIYDENPILGKGLGSWKIEILKHANYKVLSEDNRRFYQRPHNDFIWVLCELGIIGVIAYALIFIYVFYLCVILLRSDFPLKIKYFILALIFFITGFVVVSFFSFPLERMEHIIFLAFALGSVLTLINYNKKSKSKKLWVNYKLLLIIFSVITLFSIYLGSMRYFSEIHLKKALYYKSAQNWKLVISEVDKMNLVFYPIDMLSTPVVWYKGLACFNLKRYTDAYKCFKSAYNVNPYHIYVLNDFASCSSVLGKTEESIKLYKKALDIIPDFEDALYNISTIYYQKRNMDSAYFYFSKIENVDTQKYNKYMRVLVNPKIKEFLKSDLQTEIKSSLQTYLKDPENLKRSIRKAQLKNIKLEKQLLTDISHQQK